MTSLLSMQNLNSPQMWSLDSTSKYADEVVLGEGSAPGSISTLLAFGKGTAWNARKALTGPVWIYLLLRGRTAGLTNRQDCLSRKEVSFRVSTLIAGISSRATKIPTRGLMSSRLLSQPHVEIVLYSNICCPKTSHCLGFRVSLAFWQHQAYTHHKLRYVSHLSHGSDPDIVNEDASVFQHEPKLALVCVFKSLQ